MNQPLLAIEEIFNEALQRSSTHERDRYLDSACEGNAALKARVQRLLAAHPAVSNFLEAPAPDPGPTSATFSNSVGALIGPYKLLEQIGEGGMGLVYMAEQQQPVRRLVALKIIKPGMDTKQVIARFEAERQALAMMDHPNIAKVHDAGTTDTGHPYFVMELVRGLPINEFCDQKRLTVRERLQLFVQVCQAVQHAHQKGIIHRDLKPTNVLVTMADTVAFPKLLDFGIAKALGQSLTDRTLHTGYSQLVGTPLYMSPEQAEMNLFGVDTRSDVYSLGVLLYELLTGTTPFDKEKLTKASFDEMRRIIREEEPETVSARIARTRSAERGARSEGNVPRSEFHVPRLSELDWIVMKALEKDRSRRYESASALAADIQSYLSDEPVLACPPTTMYRFQKFARKHKPALATAAAIALCLLLGTTVSAWQAIRATAAEEQAAANEAEAKASAKQADEKTKEAKEKAQEATQERDEAQKQRDEVKAIAEKLAAKEEELQRTLYADHIHMAQAAWDNGSVTRAAQLLGQHLPKQGEPDRRGFEWHYLNRLSQIGPLVSFRTPLLQSYQLKLSPDRTRLIRFKPAGPGVRNGKLAVKTGPELQVWNLQTGQVEFTAELTGVPDQTRSRREAMPEFTADGEHLVLNGSRFLAQAGGVYVPGDLKIWETRTGKEIFNLSGVIGGVWFSPDAKLLAITMEDQSIKLWDKQTGQERLTLKGQLKVPNSLAFSPDGKRLAAAGDNKWDNAKNTYVDGEIRIWDVHTGEQLKAFKGQAGWMNLVFSPDGQRLLTHAEENSEIKLWDTHTGNELATFGWDTGTAYEASFNADGTRLIAACYQKEKEREKSVVSYAKLWNAQTGQELLSLKADELQFSPDGKRVAMSDWANSRTKVFDAQSGQIMLSVKDAGSKFAFCPDSKRLATQAGGMRIWDLETGDEINHIKGFIGDFFLAFSHDGKRLIGSNQSSAQVWDAEVEQKSVQQLTLSGVNRQDYHSMGDSPAVFSSDFKRVAGISFKTVKLFDANSGQELRSFSGHENNVTCVALSPDGKRIAASDGRHTPARQPPTSGVVKVWDVDTGSELFSTNTINMAGHAGHAVIHLAFSSDGNKLAGSAGDLVTKVWEAQSGRELYTIGSRSGPSLESTSFGPWNKPAFSPDGARLATAGKIWDAETGQQLVALKGSNGCFGFSPDGKRVLGAGGARVPPSERSGRRSGGSGVFDADSGEFLFHVPFSQNGWVTFSPDGKRLADGRTIWDAQTGQELLNLGQERGGNSSGQVAFSPDGHRLALVPSFANEVTIYDATPLPEKP